MKTRRLAIEAGAILYFSSVFAHGNSTGSLYFNDAGWPVVAPFEYSGDEISSTGYNTDDIVGTYEFIDHGTSTDGKIISSQNIKLNADGTISGAVSGTWQQDAANSAADLTIGGAVYKGHFLAAKDK